MEHAHAPSYPLKRLLSPLHLLNKKRRGEREREKKNAVVFAEND